MLSFMKIREFSARCRSCSISASEMKFVSESFETKLCSDSDDVEDMIFKQHLEVLVSKDIKKTFT